MLTLVTSVFTNKTIATGDEASKATLGWSKLQDQMAAVAPNLDLVVDWDWLWFIAKPLHTLLSFIQGIVVNWDFWQSSV